MFALACHCLIVAFVFFSRPDCGGQARRYDAGLIFYFVDLLTLIFTEGYIMLLFVVRHGDPIYDPDSLTPLGKLQA